jgi:hypothetical protein
VQELVRPRPGPAAVELAEGKLAVILGCSAGLDVGLGERCVLLPCLRRSEIGPACFACDEQRSALCQIHGRWGGCRAGPLVVERRRSAVVL